GNVANGLISRCGNWVQIPNDVRSPYRPAVSFIDSNLSCSNPESQPLRSSPEIRFERQQKTIFMVFGVLNDGKCRTRRMDEGSATHHTMYCFNASSGGSFVEMSNGDKSSLCFLCDLRDRVQYGSKLGIVMAIKLRAHVG